MRDRPAGDRTECQMGDVSGGMAAVGKDILQIGAEAGSTVEVGARQTRADERRVYAPWPRAFGRHEDLGRVLSELRRRRSTVLHGMGGTGKTALTVKAAETLHRAKANRDGVL